MEITHQNKDNYSIIKIAGRLDTTNYQELEKALNGLLEDNRINLILDCAELDYVSSSGLRVFLMFLKKVKALNGKFIICNMQDNIKEIFQISGFTSIFEIHDDLAAAEEAAKTGDR